MATTKMIHASQQTHGRDSHLDPQAGQWQVLLFRRLHNEMQVVREADVTRQRLNRDFRKHGCLQALQRHHAVVADEEQPGH